MQITILGAGESGVGAAVLAKKNNFNVFVSDNGQINKSIKTFFYSMILNLKKENIQQFDFRYR